MIEVISTDNKDIGSSFIKNLIWKYGVLISFIVFTFVLLIINLSWVMFASEAGTLSTASRLSIGLSFMSAFFGMLNITTYSLYNPHSKNKEKFRIFIVFNTLAVMPLAYINYANDLWFLMFENIAFFLSGLYQYYSWFIKEEKIKEDTNGFELKFVNKYGKGDTILYAFTYFLLTGIVFSTASIGITLLTSDYTWDTLPNYLFISGLIDGFVFSLSITSAFLVGKRVIESQVFYIIGDAILIAWWLFNAFALPDLFVYNNPESVARLSALSIVILFSFYMTSNIINYHNWTRQNKVGVVS